MVNLIKKKCVCVCVGRCIQKRYGFVFLSFFFFPTCEKSNWQHVSIRLISLEHALQASIKIQDNCAGVLEKWTHVFRSQYSLPESSSTKPCASYWKPLVLHFPWICLKFPWNISFLWGCSQELVQRDAPRLVAVYLTLFFAAALIFLRQRNLCLQVTFSSAYPQAATAKCYWGHKGWHKDHLPLWRRGRNSTMYLGACGVDVLNPPDHQSLKGEVKMLPVFSTNGVVGCLTLC